MKRTDYEAAGVSIDRGNALVANIKPLAQATQRHGALGGLGGFGALFDLSATGYRQPILVSGADGAGTKIKLAIELDRHKTIGIDLVAMCVNDILAHGAEPLFFLDYFACSSLDVATATEVITGIAQGCELAGCALAGGETAEMPGMYRPGDYDLAGFCVGVVEKQKIITGEHVREGDALIALSSSGPHANGFSLIRKILADSGVSLTDRLDGIPFSDLLLEPTRIYRNAILTLMPEITLKAVAHITGGGLTENLPRVIPADACAEIEVSSWRWPGIFQWLQETGNVATDEMRRTFNCGIGMVLVVSAQEEKKTLELLGAAGEQAWRLGTIRGRDGGGQARYLSSSGTNSS